jgi:hypothetical protein
MEPAYTMEWLSTPATVISRFAGTHGIALAVAGATVALIMALPKLFEKLPEIVESIYKRRATILEARRKIHATKAEGRANKIRAITDQKASQMRLKQQARVLARAKVENPDDAVKLLMAIHADPDQPEKRRLPDKILGELYSDRNSSTADKGNSPGAASGKGSTANVRGLPKSGSS